ncbi:serine hydrolase [Sphingomonas sp. AOB5]|uniref:serine hydrolase domain-containing protein n=1 Tax=Sphingomonas sp. AOB5 TaxID=3034017 RepID=UPI0023F65AA5|nr:serine hydrolase domain-containing protein [Sphingomonas sp. AOB5]MDF7774863.1 serine hydrolase [Sphingomonas sp. AOB5]
MSNATQQFEPAIRNENSVDFSFPIQGYCDPRFAPVVDAFRENFVQIDEEIAEVGACACVIENGKTVVDIWGGYRDEHRTDPWRPDTIVAVRSNSKGLCGVVANIMADRGQLDLDAPVATYWPEFAANGKQDLPVRFLLDHRAGLPVLTEKLWPGAVFDWEAMTTALAAQAPLWTPGEQAGYHTITQGFLVGEVVRRITGKMIGEVARELVSGPLEADFFIGLKPDEEARCADFIDIVEGTVYDPKTSRSPYADRLRAQFPAGPQANSATWRQSQVPSSSGHANARGMARMFSAVLGYGDHPLLSEAGRKRMTTIQHNLHESVGNRSIRQGMGTIINSPPWAYFGPNPNTFGSHGFGGSLAVADPDNGLAISYAMNQPHRSISTGIRSRRIADATYRSLGIDVPAQ